MTTEAIYQEIRECIQYRIKQDERVMETSRGLPYVLASARIEAYRLALDDLDASRSSLQGRAA